MQLASNVVGSCDHRYLLGSSPSVSYLHGSNGEGYRFEDSNMEEFSLIPPVEIENKKVLFMFSQKHALLYEGKLFYSLPDFLKKVKLPDKLNEELLDKIATMANFLIHGKDYQYVTGTAKQEGEKVLFNVKKQDHLLCMTFSFPHKKKG